jgi:hypothetical protein
VSYGRRATRPTTVQNLLLEGVENPTRLFDRVEGLFSLIAMLVWISMIADESLQGGYN